LLYFDKVTGYVLKIYVSMEKKCPTA